MPRSAPYVACLDLTGRSCLVVGGGRIGLEKVEGLLTSGAAVTVVAPEAEDALRALPVRWLEREYRSADLAGRYLVVAATASREVNRQVFADAEARSLLCNVVDTPDLCSFILPAIHRRGSITVAVSTAGASPALAKRLRDELGAHVTDHHVELAERLRRLRPWAKAHYATYDERRRFFEELLEEALA